MHIETSNQRGCKARTFENHSILRGPYIVKCPGILTSFKIEPPRPISENADLGRIQEIAGWIPLEFASICIPRCGKGLVKAGVLAESKPFLVFATSEVPKNFC